MSSISKGWSTSFIYKQDLTSYYMNSLLRTIIRPGIYNANMGIYNGDATVTVGSQIGQENKFCLLIKRGTTFVFSNDYKTGSLGYRRNFNHVDEESNDITPDESFCLIKSVALSDMNVFLGDISTYDDGIYSIHSFIKYNPLSDGHGITDTPTFFLVKEKTLGENETSGPLYKNVSTTRYSSSQNSQDIGISENDIFIIDGITNLSLKETQDNFYLNVGFIEIKKVNNKNQIVSFTGRGLPEYRYLSSLDSYRMVPDIIPNMVDKSADSGDSWNTLYFDIPETFIGTTVVKSSLKTTGINYSDSAWEGAYLARRNNNSTEKISFGTSADTNVFAVYGLVSTIRSFSSPASVEMIKISFGKENVSSVIPYDTSKFSQFTFVSTDKLGDVPLDVSPMNIYSLLDCIEGYDIWSYVIDKARKSLSELSQQNFTEIGSVTDIIPIALVTVTNGKIDHSKTLCYFGLQERLGKINVLNVKEHNFFNVIPVME